MHSESVDRILIETMHGVVCGLISRYWDILYDSGTHIVCDGEGDYNPIRKTGVRPC